MNTDDNDKLWKLFGKTRQPTVSPFFARNVLRAVRQEEEARSRLSRTWSSMLRLGHALRRKSLRFVVTATCIIAALITVTPATFVRHHHVAPAEAGIARQIVGNPDYETIKHLDELVADEESSLWLDDSVH